MVLNSWEPFGYVDDEAILAPTVTSLRICDEFSKKFDVQFNPDKYQILVYKLYM